MKAKFYSIALLLASISCFVQATNKIYLENQYGAPIVCKTNTLNQPVTIANNDRLFIGTIVVNSKVPAAHLTSLQIGTPHAWSKYETLHNTLEEMRDQKMSQCNPMQKECSDDAVIVINSTYSYNWNASVRWESSKESVTFELQDLDEKNVLQRLQVLVQNSKYDEVVKFINQHKFFLQRLFKNVQLNAIVTGAHSGADSHQKEAALKFIANALNKQR